MSIEIPNKEGLHEGKLFTNLKFTQQRDKKGNILAYISSEKGRKTIKLTAPPDGKVNIDLDKKYNVRVIGDSDPDDELSGYYTAVIDTTEIPDWEKSEELVSAAENSDRQLKKAKRVLYKETGLTESEREKTDNDQVLYKSKRPRVAEKALKKEDEFEKVIEETFGAEGSYENQFLDFKMDNLRTALQTNRELELELEKLRKQKADILSTLSGEPSGAELEALDDIESDIFKVEVNQEQLLASTPEAYYGLHLKKLKEYKEDLANGKIVETEYVKEEIADVVSHIRAGKPVLIYGHLGSGKTELALHIARNYILANRPDIDKTVQIEFTEWMLENPDASEKEKKNKLEQIETSHKSALVISGSKNMSTTELYGHQVLDIEKVKKEELDAFVKEVEEKYQKWLDDNKSKLDTMSAEDAAREKDHAHDRLLQTYLTQFKSGTISDFFLGPIYRAMQEGRPVVIDEVNAIPHEVLISLNHILTRKAGDQINVQQNSGTAITIKEGYGVIMTGNLNQGENRYVDRQDMDPALLSRLHKIEHDYLPQKTEGSLSVEGGEENELFHLLLARIMDKNGNIEAPKDAIEKLWDLAKAARVIQNVFAGKETSQAYYFKDGGARSIRYVLKESVLSLRGIDKIISQWQKDGYRNEFDYYLWTEFVGQSTNATDKAYLYQLLKDQFGFFTASKGWNQQPNYGNGGALNFFDIKAPRNAAEKVEFVGPRDVVDYAYGEKGAPKRKLWPKGGKTQDPDAGEVKKKP